MLNIKQLSFFLGHIEENFQFFAEVNEKDIVKHHYLIHSSTQIRRISI